MLNIDTAKFKAICAESRAAYASAGMDAEMVATLHVDGVKMRRADWGRKVEQSTTRSELTGALIQAAMRCIDRASEAQIKFLVDLIFRAGKQNDPWGSEPLTKAAASRMINALKA